METWAYLAWYLLLATLAPFGVADLVRRWRKWRDARRLLDAAVRFDRALKGLPHAGSKPPPPRPRVTPANPPWRPGSLPWPGTILYLHLPPSPRPAEPVAPVVERDLMQGILTRAVADLYREPPDVVAERVRGQLAPFVMGVALKP